MKTGDIVRSRTTGREYEVEGANDRGAIVIKGIWRREEHYELVVAEAEEAFDEKMERVEVEVGPDLFQESDFPSIDPLKLSPNHVPPTAPVRPVDWRMYYDNSSARRKEHPVAEGFLKYFPAAIRLVAEVSRLGNDKHNPGEKLHHARDKSGDHLDCAARHLLDADSVDGDLGIIEAVNAIWRLCAYVQEKCERQYGWPKAPNARGEAK